MRRASSSVAGVSLISHKATRTSWQISSMSVLILQRAEFRIHRSNSATYELRGGGEDTGVGTGLVFTRGIVVENSRSSQVCVDFLPPRGCLRQFLQLASFVAFRAPGTTYGRTLSRGSMHIA